MLLPLRLHQVREIVVFDELRELITAEPLPYLMGSDIIYSVFQNSNGNAGVGVGAHK